jgi:hypothetical protein
MNYSGNILADLYYNEDQNYKEMEKEKAFYCPICERYFDDSGRELNRFDAIDNYDIEQEICYDCENDQDTRDEHPDLFETLSKVFKPKQ